VEPKVHATATASEAPALLFTGEVADPSVSSSAVLPAAPTATSGGNGGTATSGAGTVYSAAFMGDSLTDFTSHGGGFIRLLQQRCPQSRFDNFGKGADMVNQMRRRFPQQVLAPGAPRYSHVVIFGGVNDLYSDQTAHRTNAKIESDLREMYTLSRQAGSKVVALTVAPWGGFSRYFNERRAKNTELLNEWIRAQRGTLVDEVIDAHQLLRCGDATRLCPEFAAPFKDGIHFGKQGHEVLGEALKTQVFADCL
jgi:lysophospholipase L1-like esterase